MSVLVYHNPQCSKSRSALDFLNKMNQSFEVIEYMKNPITVEELTMLIQCLGISPTDLLRKNEQVYKEHFKGKILSDNEWIAAMIEFPKLIERPIVVKNGKAVIARPTERINELF